MPTWLSLWSTSSQKRVSPLFFFTHRCLLDWAYDPQAAKSGSHPFSFFIFPLGLNFDCQFFQFSFFYIWTYLWLPVFHLFFLTWTYLRVPIWLCFDFITHIYLIGLTPLMPNLLGLGLFENPDLTKISSFVRRSFWNFYRVQNPLFVLHPCFR